MFNPSNFWGALHHPKGSGGDFLSPLLSHDMRGLMKTKSNHVYILFEQP